MIESIRHAHHNPGAEMKSVKFPNAMYYIPNWIFVIAIQICTPVILIGAFYTLSITLSDWSVFNAFLNVIQPLGLPCYPFTSKESQLKKIYNKFVASTLSNVKLGVVELFDSNVVGSFITFLTFYILSSYYFLQCVGTIYWKNNKK